MQGQRSGRAKERALILLLFGCAFLMPPGARIFHLEEKIAGIPVALLAVFVIWALLIVGCFLLARRLGTEDAQEDPRA